MSLTQDEKERLADRVVEILRDEAPAKRVAELRVRVEAGDEGDEGLNSAVLAVAQAILETRGR
jgi:hypothetical protein